MQSNVRQIVHKLRVTGVVRPRVWGVGALIAFLLLAQTGANGLWASTATARALPLAPQSLLAQQEEESEEEAGEEGDTGAEETDSAQEDTPTPPSGSQENEDTVTAEDDETVPLVQELGLTLDKFLSGFEDLDEDEELSAEDVISYTFAITNTGNVTLNAILLEDEALSLTEAECGDATLAPAATATCVYTYTVTLDDVAAGRLENEATVTALGPDDTEINATASSLVVLPQRPGLSLEKSFGGYIDEDDDGELGLADIVTFTFTLTNTGNVVLENVVLDDPLLGLAGEACGESTLEPGDSTTCDHPYTVTQDDMDAGEIYNVATASATVPTPEPDDEED